jgi:hypothetical protein
VSFHFLFDEPGLNVPVTDKLMPIVRKQQALAPPCLIVFSLSRGQSWT